MATDYSKFGIEANQPIDQNGNIAPRLQNPDYIANTGAHWIRLNFVLPGPAYLDRYDAIINTFLNRNIKIYAAIGHDACGDFWLGDTLRDANNPNGADWIQRYAQRYLEIVNRYRNKVFLFEAFNEPNGWQGGESAIVNVRWFVYMMNTLYQTIRPRERGIRLISAPLEGTWVNDNEAVSYLEQAYKLGNWAPGEVPWDGVGYHMYIGEDPGAARGTDGSTDPADVVQTYDSFVNRLWGVVQKYDPGTRHRLFLSEFGWTSDLGEEFQARQIQVAMDHIARDDRMALATLFCTEDFSKKYGLYTEGMGRPKQAFTAFRNLMQMNAPTRTKNVDFSKLEGALETPDPGGDGSLPDGRVPWSIGPGIMKHPLQRRGVILLPPYDDGRWARAVLDAGYHGQGGVTLCWSPGEAGLTISGEQRLVLVVNPVEWGTPDGSMLPWFRQNMPNVLVREETFLNPQALTTWLQANPDPYAADG